MYQCFTTQTTFFRNTYYSLKYENVAAHTKWVQECWWGLVAEELVNVGTSYYLYYCKIIWQFKKCKCCSTHSLLLKASLFNEDQTQLFLQVTMEVQSEPDKRGHKFLELLQSNRRLKNQVISLKENVKEKKNKIKGLKRRGN